MQWKESGRAHQKVTHSYTIYSFFPFAHSLNHLELVAISMEFASVFFYYILSPELLFLWTTYAS